MPEEAFATSGDDERLDLLDSPTSTGSAGPGTHRATPADVLESVVRFVGALARALQTFRTYPPTSPVRTDIIETARDSLRQCFAGDPDEVISLAVTSEGLKFAGELLPTSTGSERDLSHSLRRAYVSTLEFEGSCTTRDLRQLCDLVAFPETFLGRVEDLPEILDGRGVSSIRAHIIPMSQTIEGGAVAPPLLRLVERGRRVRAVSEREQAEGGWIRMDPSFPLERVCVDELPLLLHDATDLAVALQQLHGSRRERVSPIHALTAHFAEITDLYAAADPDVVDALFRRLAVVVEKLPSGVKQNLLRKHVMPGLLDGGSTGRLAEHLSDEELSGALCLLLDLGVGGVEMLSAGLASLDLPEARHATVVELVRDRYRREGSHGADELAALEFATDGQDAGYLLSVDATVEREYHAYRSLDLSVDEEAQGVLAGLVGAVAATDPPAALLRCYSDLLALSADTAVVAGVLRRSRGMFLELEAKGRIAELAEWLSLFAETGNRREETDAEVAALIHHALAEYVTPEFVHRLSLRPAVGNEEPALVTIICGLGATGVNALIESLVVESDRSARNRLLTALSPRADVVAEHLLPHLGHPEWFVVRNVLMLLGHAGPGHEDAIGGMLEYDDSRVVREALMALNRVGSPAAAEYAAGAMRHWDEDTRRRAAETIWRYEPETTRLHVLAALDDRRLLMQDPGLVRQILEEAVRREMDDLEPRVRQLRLNVLHFWHPARRSLGAYALRQLRSVR